MLKKILIFILLCVNTALALKLKHAEHSDFYRVVIETEKPVKFEEIPFLDSRIFVVSISAKSKKISKKILKKKYVKSLDIIYSADSTKFVFEVSSKVKGYKIYTLKKPFRIVIDLVKEKKREAKKTSISDDPIFEIIMGYELKEKKHNVSINFNEKKIIVIDPGHGGKDPGAIANGLKEKDVNLKIARKLKEILEKDPRFKVYLTRNSDRYIKLYDRTVFAVKKKADLFISIHCNSSPTRTESGTYIYTLNLRGARSKLARLVEQRENKAVIDYVRVSSNPVVNRIVADLAISTTMTEGRRFAYYLKKYLKNITDFRDIDSANFAVLKTPGIPSVLIETLYLTDPADAQLLKNDKFIENFSYSIYNAITDYFFKE
ncbi:AMIN domain-containing protein [Persephonella atlantica]|uniref:N-acetylmuramoyl-L-alanine amidase n=1 Tax=Persephonella atlantica TaxID=2699429 RepID=A0ABS1GG66_9AQUI|nr:N-acetylmuramoyl-L-alanine amidase [Persephonella atlantica]MBK3331919.1 AMIN domain-containing protein [Persephonella atlantica]